MILITQERVGRAHNEILALQMAARSKGWDVIQAPSGWRLNEELTKSGVKGVPYGSQTFCEVIAQQMGWTLKGNSFDWLAKLPYNALGRKVDFMTLGEAEKLTERKFIKPADDKCFDAKIYMPGEFKPHEIISKDYPVLVSDVVQFDLEYRCFVIPKSNKSPRIKTWSNYIFYEEIANPKFWNMIPAELGEPGDWLEPYLYDFFFDGPETVPSVIDVGRIPGQGWAIIETNQAWASGLYGCDPVRALEVMEAACE
ncbi:MAG TPA: ATP-grasp domain-containing protein [Anaerovoracaceae bacterium]|nr:ATP-grasp domain-containing protein [Anaerovoracaceae bacterium]